MTSEMPVVAPTASAEAVLSALAEAGRAGPPVSLQWPFSLMAYRPSPRRETRVAVSIGDLEYSSPDYRLRLHNVKVEVAIPRPASRGPAVS